MARRSRNACKYGRVKSGARKGHCRLQPKKRSGFRGYDGMSKKDYIEAAKILSNAPTACRTALVDDFARMFARDNPAFSVARFKAAVR